MDITIRPEEPADYDAMDDLLELAFAFDPHSQQNEARIVRTLRQEGKLILSLVAIEESGELVGQIAFSPVHIEDGTAGGLSGWVGLGPMSVNPRLQRQGIGRQLIERGLTDIKSRGIPGCVVLGEPGFYQQFGFSNHPELELLGVLEPFFLSQSFQGEVPSGRVWYEKAFSQV